MAELSLKSYFCGKILGNNSNIDAKWLTIYKKKKGNQRCFGG
jgi:hypothetical protein